MMFFKTLAVAAAVGTAVAQRPDNTSICDYYTTALLMNNTAANQKMLLTLVVNTAIIGNYTQPNVGVTVPGILAKGTYNGTKVDLAPYFNGGLTSTNTGGSSGMSVSFLDGGGAAPLMKNLPADDNTSNQYILLTHLYEYFGTLLGCSMQGTADYPGYAGDSSMYDVHKFMDLQPAEIGYFITQVALSAASFGVAASDLQPVGMELNALFGYKCAPETTIIPSQGAMLQAICIDDTCPLSPNATCSAYQPVVTPTASNMTVATTTMGGTTTGTGKPSGTNHGTSHSTGTSTGTGTGTSSSASASVSSSNGAAAGKVSISVMAAAGGLAAFLL